MGRSYNPRKVPDRTTAEMAGVYFAQGSADFNKLLAFIEDYRINEQIPYANRLELKLNGHQQGEIMDDFNKQFPDHLRYSKTRLESRLAYAGKF
jgi:hypothetical protein